MQWSDGGGSFIGHEGELSADVAAGPSVPDLRQYRGPTDSFSPRDPAGSESQTAHDTFCKKDDSTGSGGVARWWCSKARQIARRGVLSELSLYRIQQESTLRRRCLHA